MLPHQEENQPQYHRQAMDLLDAQFSMAEEEASSFSTALIPATPMQMPSAGLPSSPQSPQRASYPPMIMASIPMDPSDEASSYQVDNWEDPVLLNNVLNIMIAELVRFLLLKYQMQELITEEEILDRAVSNYEWCYPRIVSEAIEGLRLVFGVEMIEVDPVVHSYILVTALGITYNGLPSGVLGMPKTGLLIVVLGVIFMEGNCVSEETVWEMLNGIEVYPGKNHFIYGEPKKLITEEFVQEGYLECRQVPNTDPVRYEFLWGPRAHAETTKMRVLEFFARITGSDPTDYPMWYAEALRDEQERAWA